MKTKFSAGSQEGVIAVITVLFITFLALIVIALAAIILPRLRVSAEIKWSVRALYAADSALEWCLYKPKNPSAIPLANPLSNGATWILTQQDPIKSNCSDPGGGPVKSLGTYQRVTRSLEISGF